MGLRALKIFRCTMRSWLPVQSAINPSVTNGAITVAAEMRFPRCVEPYICLALALFLIWDFGSGLVELADDGTASRVWCFFGNLDHHVIF